MKTLRWLALMAGSLALCGAAAQDRANQEVSAVMDAWREAMIHRDRAALDKLYAADLVYSHSNAREENKTQAIDAVVNGPGRFEAIDFADMSIRVYGGTAVVRGKETMHMNTGGQLTSVPLSVLHVWVKNPAGWQMAARQATRLEQLAQTPPLSGIAHLAWRVSDVEAARAFYAKLGYEAAFEFSRDGKPTEVFLKVNDRQYIELYPSSDASQPPGLMHVCYEAADLEAVNAEYVKRGLAASPVRKAGAGNLLFVFRDPEGQVIEYTQYMPGSRHTEDRGKHLGAQRISEQLLGVTFPVKDLAAERAFYTGKLGFEQSGGPERIRLGVPGGSGQAIELEAEGPGVKPGLAFAVPDVARTAAELQSRGLTVKTSPTSVSVTDPDGAVIVFAPGAAH